jgi:hypothetical protein
MVSSEQAVEKAFNYLAALGPKYLGQPESPRLETIQRFDDEWLVVLSYMITGSAKSENPVLKALTAQRKYKEFEINAETGEVLAMRNPEDRPQTSYPQRNDS